MYLLTFLVPLVVLHSLNQCVHVIGQLMSCGQYDTEGPDVAEDTGIVMTVTQSLMTNDIDLVPNLDYEVSMTSTGLTSVTGFRFSCLSHADNETAERMFGQLRNTTCPHSEDDYKLPITLIWASPTDIDLCLSLRFDIMLNSGSKQTLSTVLCPMRGCYSHSSATSGILTSPSFPNDYPDNANCTFYVVVPQEEAVDLQFLDLESPYASKCFDFIEIRTNNASYGPYCGKWSRRQLKALRFVAHQAFRIRFQSDNKLHSSGFKAIYQSVSLKKCDQTLTNLSGIVSSPGYPQNFCANTRCKTSIVLPSNYRMRVKVTDLDLDPSVNSECAFDKVSIFDSHVHKILCGSTDSYSQSDLRFESSGSSITIEFVSDHVGEGRGFSVSYLGVPSCHNETFTMDNGSVTSINFPLFYPNGQECFYTINLNTQSEHIELTFDMFHTESDEDARYRNDLCNKDYVEVFDGRVSHRVCGNWRGHEYLLVFKSFSSSLVFKFVSNEQVTRPGFYAKWRTLDSSEEIPSVSTWLDTGNTCFEIIYQKNNWFDSDLDCRARGGHLATIADLATEVILNEHLSNSNCTRPGDSFWIGANDRRFESDFYWTDGSKVKFSDWFRGWSEYAYANSQPSDDGFSQEDCVELRKVFHFPFKGQGTTDKYVWNDRNCNVKNPYVCQCYKQGYDPPVKKTLFECNQTFELSAENSSISFTSPGYPGKYPNFLDCKMIVYAPRGYSLVLKFHDLNLEMDEGCQYDYLTVSPFPWDSHLAENETRLCGNWTRKPKLLRRKLSTNWMFLNFVTDHSFQFPGFSATVTIVNDSSICASESWLYNGSVCITMSSLPVTSNEATEHCEELGEADTLLKAIPDDVLGAISRQYVNDGSQIRFWHDIQNDTCQAAIYNQHVNGNLSVPTEIVVESVPCNSTILVLCYKNISDGSGVETRHVITSPSGNISSQGNDSDIYKHNVHHTWQFEANATMRILFKLWTIDIEYQDNCLYDFLIINGTLPEGRYCGSATKPLHFLSRKNKAEVILKSDYDTAGKGFGMSWMWINMEQCTNTLVSEKAEFASFNFPFAYPDVLDCKTVINGYHDRKLFLVIEYLRLPEGADNYLEVQLGVNSSLIYRNTSSVPLTLVSLNSLIILTLKAASLNELDGFRGFYKQLSDPFLVPSQVTQVNPTDKVRIQSIDFPLTYPSAVKQKSVFRAPIGHTLSLTFNTFNLETSRDCSKDVLTVSDVSLGDDKRVTLKRLCCERKNSNCTTAAVVSLYNRLELYFVSADVHTTEQRSFTGDIEARKDKDFLNKTAELGGQTFDSCKEEPCLNDGVCKQVSEDSVICMCPGYYTGMFCQVTHCQLNPCVYGRCELTATNFTCECDQGYWGHSCSYDDAGCRHAFCSGKGDCTGNVTNQPECVCDQFMSGHRCDVPHKDPYTAIAIGQRLLAEPIWIGLIVILSVLLAFGIFYIIRRKCGKHFTCCDIKVKKKEEKTGTEPKPTPMLSFSELKARRCSIPPPLPNLPIISVTKAEDSCVSTPGGRERPTDVAARFFASYKEAERTPISAPVAVDFSKTTATSLASDSDDNSFVGGLVGGTLNLTRSRLNQNDIRRSISKRMKRSSTYLQTPKPHHFRDRMKRSHSTGPFLVRQASLCDDAALSQHSMDIAGTSTEHFYPNVIVSNENEIDDAETENSSIKIYLDEPEDHYGPYKQMSRSEGSVNELKLKVSSWRSVAIADDNCRFHHPKKEKLQRFKKSASVDQLKDHRERCHHKSKSEVTSFESAASCDCACYRHRLNSTESSGRRRRSIWHNRSHDQLRNHSCESDRIRRTMNSKRRHHRHSRQVHSCGSVGHSPYFSKAVTRASSTESEQYEHKRSSHHRKPRSHNRSSSRSDALSVLGTDTESARRELFRKFFSQEVQYASEASGTSSDVTAFLFPDVPRVKPKPVPLEDTEKDKNEATCSVIVYNCTPRRRSMVANYDGRCSAEKSMSQEDDSAPKFENDSVTDSAICSSEATTSSDSFKSHKKVLGASSSLLTVTTDTDSALSSAPKSFQASPFHGTKRELSGEIQTKIQPDVRLKDSAYQTKQSSVDVMAFVDRPEEIKRKLSLPTTLNEETNVTQRLHMAACKLFLLQQRVRRNRFSKDSAVHTISEDELHDLDDECGTNLFPHGRFRRPPLIPLRHLDKSFHRTNSGAHVTQLKSTATPVSDADQGSEIGEINV